MPRLGKKRRGINDMCSHVTDGVEFLYAGTRHGTIYGRKMVGDVTFSVMIPDWRADLGIKFTSMLSLFYIKKSILPFNDNKGFENLRCLNHSTRYC